MSVIRNLIIITTSILLISCGGEESDDGEQQSSNDAPVLAKVKNHYTNKNIAKTVNVIATESDGILSDKRSFKFTALSATHTLYLVKDILHWCDKKRIDSNVTS
jgi:hypothetical protein